MLNLKAIRRNGSDKLECWFELSYAQFITIPRLVVTSMPDKWQGKLADLLNEMDDTFDWRPKKGRFWVRMRDDKGRFSSPELCNYRHGNIEHLRRVNDVKS